MQFSLFESLNLLGTFAFAVSGVMKAIEKEYDLFGILVLAFVTAIGGGTIRDLLIGQGSVAWMRDNNVIYTIFLAFFLATVFFNLMKRFERWVTFFDSVGLAIFTIIGIHKGMQFHFNEMICIALGTITGTFGGVIRDVLAGDKPLLFHKEIYALACIIGGSIYFFLRASDRLENFAEIICCIIIIAIRLLSLKFNISLPKIHVKTSEK
ncbi:putative membrane protein YeiH [Chitinophaga skermanii]|uniref:Putative membrane protein YeiH n=1 Tax=Chitinophaga skermanii TaxID=331697 RepID=A0A327QPS4_9BACT|nr:trimeric intracellular cation channel family protein [Chitinophaga skermanii]RAJ06626.1 putative membrane protein YeiH [Chitinophaga skermanii]